MPRGSIHFARLACLSLLLAAPGVARADLSGPELTFHTTTTGDALTWQQTSYGVPGEEPGEVVVVQPWSGDSSTSAQIHRYTGDSFFHLDSHDIGIFGDGITIESAASAANWGNNHILVADPQVGVVWNVGTTITSLDLSVFAGSLTGTPDSTSTLCWPVATAAHAFTNTNRVAWYVEGSLRDHEPPWAPFMGQDCASDAGGVQRRSSTLGAASFELDGGLGPGMVPIAPTKGMAIDATRSPPQLLVVAGHGISEEGYATPRIVRKNLSSDASGDGDVDNWYLPADGAEVDRWNLMGEPSMIAPLSGDRVAIGGGDGLKLYDRQGSWLQDIWIVDLVEQSQTISYSELLGIASDPQGDYLYALFGNGADGRLLAAWDAGPSGELATLEELLFCVGPELTDGGCDLGSGECAVVCDTIGEAVAVAPAGSTVRVERGVYEEALLLHRRRLTLKAEVQGQVTVVGEENAPTLAMFYTGLEPVVVDGFVFEGGGGYFWDAEDMQANLGGGVLMVGGALEMSHSVVRSNTADLGAGLAALLSPAVQLHNVGVLHNDAVQAGGGLAIGFPGLYDRTSLRLVHTTVAGNEAPWGTSACVADVDVEAFLAILDGPAPSLCTWDAPSISGGLDYSSLWPDEAWQIWDLEDEVMVDLPDGAAGADAINADCDFEDRDWMDYHLRDGSPCADVWDGAEDPDGSPADMGMYGGEEGDWDWDRELPPEDDDDSGPVDDDDTGDDDDSVVDDDDDGDDDDSAPDGWLPSGFRCDCNAAAGAAPGLSLLLLALLGLRRRR